MRYFFLALLHYTRIPAPRISEFRPTDPTKALRFFTLIGIIVGLVSSGVFLLCRALFTPSVATILSLAAGIMLTGCFHEDGFADMLDGFGGGIDRQRTLEIMKDSRIGSYGVIGLILLLGTKFLALRSLLASDMPWWIVTLVFVTIHSLARATSGTLVFTSRYAPHDCAKTPLSHRAWGWQEVIGLYLFGLTPLMILSIFSTPWLLLIPLVLLLLLLSFRHLCYRRIQGYTGDCLGALEQLAELTTTLCLLSIFRLCLHSI